MFSFYLVGLKINCKNYLESNNKFNQKHLQNILPYPTAKTKKDPLHCTIHSCLMQLEVENYTCLTFYLKPVFKLPILTGEVIHSLMKEGDFST